MNMMLEEYRYACKIVGRLVTDTELKVVLDAHSDSPNLKALRLLKSTSEKIHPSSLPAYKGHQLTQADRSVFQGMWVLAQIIEDILGIKKSTIKNYRKLWVEDLHWKIGPVGKCVYSVDAINEFMKS